RRQPSRMRISEVSKHKSRKCEKQLSYLYYTQNSTKKWVSSLQRVSSSTVLLALERRCWPRLLPTKRQQHSCASSDLSLFRNTWAMDQGFAVKSSKSPRNMPLQLFSLTRSTLLEQSVTSRRRVVRGRCSVLCW